MKTNDPNDEKLAGALRSWRVSEPLPPRFQEQVWSRIERAEVLRGRSWLADAALVLERLFAKPAIAYAYVIVLLAVGLTGGYLKAQQRENRIGSQLAVRYVQSIDPYQKADH